MTFRQHLALALAWVSIALLCFIITPNRDANPAVDAEDEWLLDDDAAWFGDEPFAADAALHLLDIDWDAGKALIRRADSSRYYAPTDRVGEATLVAIVGNAVLLKNQQVFSLLCCAPQVPGRSPGGGLQSPELIDLREDDAAIRTARYYHRQLYFNPLALIGKVDIQNRSGEYRLFPGSDREAFATFGFRPGDRVLGVNGIALTQADAIAALYQNLAGASHIAVTLERDGKNLVILLALDKV